MSDRVDITDDIEIKHGRANPFGWSQFDVHYEGKHIGWIEAGNPMDFVDGYSFELVPEGVNVRLKVFKETSA